MSFGFKGKIKETVLAMQKRRAAGEDVTLRSFMAETYPDAHVEHLYGENNINPNRTTVEELMEDEDNGAYLMVELARDGVRRGLGTAQRDQRAELRHQIAHLATVSTDPNARFLAPDQLLDPVRVGQAEAAFYNDLIIRDVPVGSLEVTMPKIDQSKAKPKKTREGAKIELGTISYKEKKVQVYEYALGLEFTYNSVRYQRLNLVPLYFEDMGAQMAALKNDELTMIALNGDQADGSESSVVIGVEDPTKGFQWIDFVRVMNRMKRMGRIVMAGLFSEEAANKWENMPEVKNRVQGVALLANRRTAIPQNLDVYIGGGMPAPQRQFIAPALAYLQLTAQSVLLEAGKVISKRLEEAYVSEACGFMNFQRDARVTVDETLSYAANPFPEWFNVRR